MKVSIYNSDNFITKPWSGGITTELFIYPENSVYSKLDFAFRLSTATVEIETSTFTALPGVSRQLMVLDGSIILIHKDHHNAMLEKGQTDSFMGNWTTESHGKCTDLNLMTMGSCKGRMECLFLEKKSLRTVETAGISRFILLYLYEGALFIKDGNIEHIMKQGELMVVTEMTASEIELRANLNCTLALITIDSI